MKKWLMTAVFGAGLALSSGVSNALTPQQQGEMYNQCSHPNYQGDSSRCGGGGYSSHAPSRQNYFYVGIAKAPDGRRILLSKRILSHYQPEKNKAQVKQEVLAKCNNLVGGGCEISGVDEDACVAVASNPSTTRQYGHVVGYKQCAEAQKAAIAYCREENPTTANQCKVTETVRSPSIWFQ